MTVSSGPSIACSTELDDTISRPLGSFERHFVNVRGKNGSLDGITMVYLNCVEGPSISDHDVVLAWAVLRLRHPLLAARLMTSDSVPKFVFHVPATEDIALEQGRAEIVFSTFVDREAEVTAFRDHWTTADPKDVLGDPPRMSTLAWFTDVDKSAGKYALGLYTTHMIADAPSLVGAIGQFIALLAAPWQARAELTLRTSAPGFPSIELPSAIEHCIPDISECSVEEHLRGEEAFVEFMRPFQAPMSGICVNDSNADYRYNARIVRRTWSRTETTRIVQTCRVHGVTVTQFIRSVLILAVIDGERDRVSRGLYTQSPDDAYHFTLPGPVRLTPMLSNPSVRRQFALRIAMYPILLTVPQSVITDDVAIWEVARQCKAKHDAFVQSPYFWHVLGHYQSFYQERVARRIAAGGLDRPAKAKVILPGVSSLGDLTKLLPMDVRGSSPPQQDSTSRSISVKDMTITARANIASLYFHLWTFSGQMNVQLVHDTGFVDEELADDFLCRLIAIVARVVTNSE